jgi:hypothetical protein
MTTNDRLDILGKQIGLLNDFTKFAGALLLCLFVLAILVFPAWVNERLKAVGVKIEEVTFPGIKLVANETVKANGNAIEVANSLTTTEIKLANMMSALEAAKREGAPAVSPADVQSVLDTVRSAQGSLDQQAAAIRKAGKEVGATSSIPETGWVYVGYYGDDANLRILSDRVEKNPQVQQLRAPIKEIVLAYDAPVVADGNLCNKMDITSVPIPDPNAPEREYVIVRASRSPLRVLAQAECPAAGKGKTVYAQVAVPPDRVRMSKLSQLVRPGSSSRDI